MILKILAYWSPVIKLWLIMLLGMVGIYIIPTIVISQLFFYQKAEGSFISVNKQIIGSSLYGQQFDQNNYFWGRPSLTHYKSDLLAEKNIHWVGDVYWQNFLKKQQEFWHRYTDKIIPNELLWPSSSQVDPHISIAAAQLQIPRIKQARHISASELNKLIALNTEKPFLWLFGKTRVNVLELNISLDNYGNNKHDKTFSRSIS